MRFSRLLSAAPLFAVAFALSPARLLADDTAAFLNPDNWEGQAAIWRLKGTTLVGETKEDPKFNTFFCSKKKYSDFELSFKVRLRGEVGNSGVQIRSEVFDHERFKVRGPQADIGKGYWGSLYGEGVGGMMKQSDPKAIAKAVKGTEFNTYTIRAKGNHITIKINGETMVDQDFPVLPGKGGKPLPKEGIIAFQAHAGFPMMQVEYKDIKFTDLSKK